MSQWFHLMVVALSMPLVFAGCDGPDVPNPPGLNSGPASNTLYNPVWSPGGDDDADAADAVRTLCQRILACMGDDGPVTAPSLDLDLCAEDLELLSLLLPDPGAFASCVDRLSCQDLMDFESVMASALLCSQVDRAASRCAGPATLEVCTTGGACRLASCAVVCAVTQEGSTGGFCEMNDKGPYCGCRHDPGPAPTDWDASQ